MFCQVFVRCNIYTYMPVFPGSLSTDFYFHSKTPGEKKKIQKPPVCFLSEHAVEGYHTEKTYWLHKDVGVSVSIYKH